MKDAHKSRENFNVFSYLVEKFLAKKTKMKTPQVEDYWKLYENV